MHEPYFVYHVFVCCNRRDSGHTRGSCAARGSEEVRDYLKRRVRQLGLGAIRINLAGCLDRCELGPAVVVYPQGIWYTLRTIEDAERMVQRHLMGGSVASDLEMPARVT